MKKTILAIATIVAITAGAAQDAAANLVVNGDFESWTGGHNVATSQLGNSGTNGYTALTGWDVGAGSSGMYGFLMSPGQADTTGAYSPRFSSDVFNIWGPGSGGGGVNNGLPDASPLGGNYVVMDGASNYRGNGISQMIGGLTVGQQYLVSFYWAAGQQHGFDGATTESVRVSLGSDTLETSTVNLPSHGFNAWALETFTFTAKSTSELLKFLAIGTPNGLPPLVMLDGLTMNLKGGPGAVVPEPGTMSLLVIGGLGLAGYKLRRRAMAKSAAR